MQNIRQTYLFCAAHFVRSTSLHQIPANTLVRLKPEVVKTYNSPLLFPAKSSTNHFVSYMQVKRQVLLSLNPAVVNTARDKSLLRLFIVMDCSRV